MTSKKLVDMALEQMQTMALVGDDRRCWMMAIRVLGLISKNWNSVPDEMAWNALSGSPMRIVLPKETAG